MVMRGRLREAGRVSKLAQARLATRQPAEDRDALFVGERLPECHRAARSRPRGGAVLPGRVADEARLAVLAQEQPRPAAHVRHERYAAELRLALVHGTARS